MPISDADAEIIKNRVLDALDVLPAITVEEGALGAIITNPEQRRRVYSTYTIVSLVLRAIGVGASAAVAAGFAIWSALALMAADQVRAAVDPWLPLIVITVAVFAFVSGAWGSLSSQVSILATANTPARK